ncbi:histone deacetylase family protein [Limibacillus sp. MBR-115]|uniref:histone deacetylase family protein n=1 Tax=Limibacillus sp. MBR-115 TaxID=3156465 RepID=UPI00339B32A3
MTTLLYSHQACLAHDTGTMHPESPARLDAVIAALEEPGFEVLVRRDAPLAERKTLELAHSAEYVARIFADLPKRGLRALDGGDTLVSPGSGEAALRAAGALAAAVDAVVAGEARNAFCAVRPPGHHAERQTAMGFCLFNNVAIGALHARVVHGCRRVAVVDFDVHHGNGTQDIFWDDPDLMLFSTHQMPLYPGTGAATESGCNHNIVNLPLPPMAGSQQFRQAMDDSVFPRLTRFNPDFILISAGFDAHTDDPLASLCLHEDDFSWVTCEIAAIADQVCGGRVVSTLEGGYDLESLARSAAAHVKALMNA